jgi:hypothetical protein
VKPSPFMISVQWGGGHHYFQAGAMSIQEARTTANYIYAQVAQTKKLARNAPHPRVMIWELKESVQDDNLGPLQWGQT